MIVDHERVQELLAGLALHALDQEELRDAKELMASHVSEWRASGSTTSPGSTLGSRRETGALTPARTATASTMRVHGSKRWRAASGSRTATASSMTAARAVMA